MRSTREFIALSAVLSGRQGHSRRGRARRGDARAIGPPHDPVRRRSAPLQQGAAGRVSAVRRAGPGHVHRRDDREPVVRGQRRAAVARAGLRARGAVGRRTRGSCSIARCRRRCPASRSSATARDALIAYADGDGRRLHQPGRAAGVAAQAKRAARPIDVAFVETTIARSLRRFDKGGEAFYDQISALHKSVRGSIPTRRSTGCAGCSTAAPIRCTSGGG